MVQFLAILPVSATKHLLHQSPCNLQLLYAANNIGHMEKKKNVTGNGNWKYNLLAVLHEGISKGAFLSQSTPTHIYAAVHAVMLSKKPPKRSAVKEKGLTNESKAHISAATA